MSHPVRISPSLPARRDRQLMAGLARIERSAQLEAATVHALGYVGQQGMVAVAMMSQLEGLLGQAVPLATTRLQGIADTTALSIAQVVADAPRRLR